MQSIFPSNPDIINTFKELRKSSEIKSFKNLSSSLIKTIKKPYKVLKFNTNPFSRMNLESKKGSRLSTPVKSNFDFKFIEKDILSNRPIYNSLIERSTYNTTQGGTVHSNVNAGNNAVLRGQVMYSTLSYFNNSNNIKSEQNKNLYEDYKFKLNQELLELLSQERESETKREGFLFNCKNQEEKEKYEKIFALERKQATQKIVKLNE